MTKILILDPSCEGDSHSHHLNAITGHATVMHKAGLQVVLGTNCNCNIENPCFDNNPVFKYTIYDDYRKKRTGYLPRLFRRLRYTALKKHITASIQLLIRKKSIDAMDHVFVPTTDWLMYQALLKVFHKHPQLPYLHLLLMYEDGNWLTGGYPYQEIINSLKSQISENRKLFIYTETLCHARHLGSALGIQIETYPFPALPFTQISEKKDTDSVYIGVLGGGRKDKGYALLPEIIKIFNTRYAGNNVMFAIQEARVEDKLSQETVQLKKIHNVTLVGNELKRPEYERQLLKCDITLFPYNEIVYRCRGSGIVNEAVANGKPVLCSEETSLTEAIVSGNGASADSPEEFANMLIQMITNLDQYRKNANTAKEMYLLQLYNNPVVRNIRNIINQQQTGR